MIYNIQLLENVPGRSEPAPIETINLGLSDLGSAIAEAQEILRNYRPSREAAGFRILENGEREVHRWMRSAAAG